MYKIVKIDLLDTYIYADVFDDAAYKVIKESTDLEEITGLAIEGFKETNPSFKNYQDWKEKAEDGDIFITKEIIDSLEPLPGGSFEGGKSQFRNWNKKVLDHSGQSRATNHRAHPAQLHFRPTRRASEVLSERCGSGTRASTIYRSLHR